MVRSVKELKFDIGNVKTPYYIVDQRLLKKNLEILERVKQETGCKILLAQKAFSMYQLYPFIGQYLDGTTASGLWEAKLGRKMEKENHIFSVAYEEEEIEEIFQMCDHIIFNSFSQWRKYKKQALEAKKEYGIRINPQCSTGEHGMYDPCAKGSRLGVIAKHMEINQLDGISGLHFHTLCEQNCDDLVTTLQAVEEKFGQILPKMKWVNFGGGHHITREDYKVELLIQTINRFKEKYGVQVYLEPGEAVVLNAGYLVAQVLDLVENGIKIAILDTSAACHMPDVLEVPYRPDVLDSGKAGEKKYTYQFAGPTCLSGDLIGEYSFEQPIEVGQRIVFTDMAHYTMVKNNTFNGMKLPSIAVVTLDGEVRVIRNFNYDQFVTRLS